MTSDLSLSRAAQKALAYLSRAGPGATNANEAMIRPATVRELLRSKQVIAYWGSNGGELRVCHVVWAWTLRGPLELLGPDDI